MNTEFRFEELRVYQESVRLSSDLFSVTSTWPPIYKYNLADQLNRAGLSISLNIAEGSSRTTQDFKHFLSISRGSCYECIPILMIAKEKGLINPTKYENFRTRIMDISKMISSLRSKITK